MVAYSKMTYILRWKWLIRKIKKGGYTFVFDGRHWDECERYV